MSSSDLARLELAKRAYQATQPSETEVQAGVRRARLAIRRPKSRRSWLPKGLVAVVLALGGLAYAKPHALADLVEGALPGSSGARHGAGARGDSAATETPALPATEPAAAAVPRAPHVDDDANGSVEASARNADVTPAGSNGGVTPAGARPKLGSASSKTRSSAPAAAVEQNESSLSDWGRVGRALAQGNDAQALSVLSRLSESDDPRTRDKADLGRAQLLMSQGQREPACKLAQGLAERGDSRTARQARTLLASCSR